MVKKEAKHISITRFAPVGDDREASEMEMKGVVYTGICLLVFLFSALGSAAYLIF